MTKLEDLTCRLTSTTPGELKDLAATRRGLILAPLLAALPAALLSEPAQAIDPAQTQVTLPDHYQWKPALSGAPAQSVETVPVFGATDKPGPYVVLIKWHPGYMSAPHTYVTDRLCFYHLRYLVGDHRASACSGSQRRWVTRTGRSHEPSWSGHAISRPLSFPHTNVPCWPLKTRLRAQKSIEQDKVIRDIYSPSHGTVRALARRWPWPLRWRG